MRIFICIGGVWRLGNLGVVAMEEWEWEWEWELYNILQLFVKDYIDTVCTLIHD